MLDSNKKQEILEAAKQEEIEELDLMKEKIYYGIELYESEKIEVMNLLQKEQKKIQER